MGVEWVLGKKEELNYEKIVLFGHSCGAHMVSLLTLSEEYRPSNHKDIKGVVGIEGFFYLSLSSLLPILTLLMKDCIVFLNFVSIFLSGLNMSIIL